MVADPSGPGAPASGEETFASRWSRRKRDARRDVQTEPAAPTVSGASGAAHGPTHRPAEQPGDDDAGGAAPLATGEPGEPGEPVLTDADMPALETLDASSDWSGFMSPGVSKGLRQAALRKLFHLSEFNVRDGLNDYDDDFTTFEPLGDLVTSDMRHQMEREEARAQAEAEAAGHDVAHEAGASPNDETVSGQEEAAGSAEPAGDDEAPRAGRDDDDGERGDAASAQADGGEVDAPGQPRRLEETAGTPVTTHVHTDAMGVPARPGDEASAGRAPHRAIDEDGEDRG